MKPTHEQIEAAKLTLIEAGYVGVNDLFSIQDIIANAKDQEIELSEEQVEEIRLEVSASFDAEQGINWGTIENAVRAVMADA